MRKFLTTLFENLAEKLREKDTHIGIPESKDIDNESQPKTKKTPKKRKQKERKDKIDAVSIKEALPSISPQKMKLISIAGDIRLDPDKAESAFMAF